MNRGIQFIRGASAAAIGVCFCQMAIAQNQPWTINISPSNPRPTDIIHVNVIVNTPLGCYPTNPPYGPPYGPSTTVSGQSIQILLTVPACLIGVPPPPYVFTTDVGPLLTGNYQINTSIRSSADGTTFSQSVPTGTISFAVAGTPPIEAIPALDSRLIVALIALLSFFATLRIRGARQDQ